MTATLPDQVQPVFDRFITTKKAMRYRRIAKRELALLRKERDSPSAGP